MKNLKLILCSKVVTFLFLIGTIFFLFFYHCFCEYHSIYEEGTITIEGMIIEMKETDEKIVLTLKTKEKIQATYYKKENEQVNLKLGDTISVTGILKYPTSNTNFYLFNYQNYLKSKGIYSLISVCEYQILKENTIFFYKIKNNFILYLETLKSKNYLMAFLLGDTSYIKEEVKTSYQMNGISHLFAVSGMHITLLIQILSSILSKFTKKKKIIFPFLCLFLGFYSFLANFSPSILRGSGSYVFNELRKIRKWPCTSLQILIFLFCLFLIINPYIIYHSGFLYSFSISFALLFFQKQIPSNHYFKSLFLVSFVAFFSSFPISVNVSFQINFLSILFNLLFVPYVSFFLFPLTIVVMIFPIFDFLLVISISILENTSLFFQNISFFTISMSHISLFLFLFYFVFIYYVLYKVFQKKYQYLLILFVIFFIHHNISHFRFYSTITMIDIGQGDAILIQLPHNKGNILIDTGGKIKYQNNQSDLTKQILLPVLKSSGIISIDYLILSHGDYDHMGEAINLVENFKIEKVIFNCGPYNDLEKELIEVLDKKKIPYYSCIKELNIDDNKLYFLNNKDYSNENDNSSVIYTKINNHKFLFMGDAGVEVEQDIIEKYNLQDIDVLKVGHHGSRTSSSKIFIDEINPKYSIISVGKNNRYGHPNDSVLDNLEESKIYRTDQDGSIIFKINKDKLKIETCPP